MSKFKPGDKVYCPCIGTDLYTLEVEPSIQGTLAISIDDTSCLYVDEDGMNSKYDVLPCVFHATEENRKKLESLYEESFAAPKRVLRGSTLCKHLLKSRSHVFCRVSNLSNEDASMDNARIRCIVACRREVGFTFEVGDSSGATYNYAVPIDTETLQPLEMEIGNEY